MNRRIDTSRPARTFSAAARASLGYIAHSACQ